MLDALLTWGERELRGPHRRNGLSRAMTAMTGRRYKAREVQPTCPCPSAQFPSVCPGDKSITNTLGFSAKAADSAAMSNLIDRKMCNRSAEHGKRGWRAIIEWPQQQCLAPFTQTEAGSALSESLSCLGTLCRPAGSISDFSETDCSCK